MIAGVLAGAEGKMRKAVEVLERELAGIRTGRANPGLVEHLRVEYYGVPTPLNQIAGISTPEPRLLLIQPWDRQALSMIEKAILKSDLGLHPANDGHVLRLAIPLLTEERRRDLVKLVRRRAEEGRVALRNIRRDALEELRSQEKNKAISQDDLKRGQEQLQKLIDSFTLQVDKVTQAKEAEVMEV